MSIGQQHVVLLWSTPWRTSTLWVLTQHIPRPPIHKFSPPSTHSPPPNTKVNYFDVPVEGVVQTVQQLNKAWAAQYTAQKGEVDGPLTTCAWVADNSEFKAQIVCLDHGIKV